jgi:hypothetical protein
MKAKDIDKTIAVKLHQIKKYKLLYNKRFRYITTGSLLYLGTTYKIQTLSPAIASEVLTLLRLTKQTLVEYDLVNSNYHNGFTIDEFIKDLDTRLLQIKQVEGKADLLQMEKQLKTLQSEKAKRINTLKGLEKQLSKLVGK